MSLLINLRVLAEQYVFAAAQAACLSSDVGGPSAGSIRKKEGPRPGSIRIRRAITAWNTSQHWYFLFWVHPDVVFGEDGDVPVVVYCANAVE